MKNITDILKNHSVDVYDGNIYLAQDILNGGAEQVSLYERQPSKAGMYKGVLIQPYNALLEAADCIAGVCLLNNRSIKLLVAMYPSTPHFVLVRLTPKIYWILGIFGLIRRLIFGLVKIVGITKLNSMSGKKTSYWLVLKQSGNSNNKIPVLPESIGISKLLDWLRKNTNYVVLRFYEKLPKLYRDAGDLDLLLDDESKLKLEEYLEANKHLLSGTSGDIRLGLNSVSGDSGMIPYYPPPLAHQILDNAIDGPAGSRIPSSKDALLSFIYHALYHSKKGYASGISSKLNKHTDKYPENDYSTIIKRMSKELSINVGETMEEMDEFLASEGWRPKLDTLAKIAETNAWVRDRFFSTKNTKYDVDSGLVVFILREWIVAEGQSKNVMKEMEKKDYKILRFKKLNNEEKQHAFENLRGGTWGSDISGNIEDWKPSFVIVAIDKKSVSMPASFVGGFERFRVRNLKEFLRNKFDKNNMSSMHSTDNTRESWEYINVCFPDEISDIHKEVSKNTSKSGFLWFLHTLSPKYIKHSFKHTLKNFLVRKFLE